MSKATLSVEIDRSLIERVRRYSAEHGKGVSETVSEFIENLPVEQPANAATPEQSGEEGDEEWVKKLTPTVRSLLGVAAGSGDEEDYRQHLLEKYGR